MGITIILPHLPPRECQCKTYLFFVQVEGQLNQVSVIIMYNAGTFQAIYSYTGLGNHEDAAEGLLSFDVGDLITEVIESTSNGWWRGRCKGKIGWFPSSYVEVE